MKNLFFTIIFLIIVACSTNKTVYWCGDHPCINKNEKKAYFKKTMIVEVKELKGETLKNSSEIEKIIQQAGLEEKIRIKKEKKTTKYAKSEKKQRKNKEKILAKQIKLKEKQRIKDAKILAKQIKLKEKQRIKDAKILSKQINRDEKRILKNEKKVAKKIIKIENSVEKNIAASSDFKNLVKKIANRNAFRPYPNINDIPN
jgi:hypothetical protein